jgi:recombinational DNA repair protein RecT
MGLTMNPAAALVYFIPRRARKRDSTTYEADKSEADYKRNVPWIVTATPSYRGLAYICTHYAGVGDIASEVVFEADEFVYRGPMEKPDHIPTLVAAKRDEKLAIGAYAVLRLRSGDYRAEFVDAATIQRARGMSDNPGGLMWTKFWTEGWRKVVVRRACKLAMQGAEISVGASGRLGAAEEAMTAADGVTVNEGGEVVERDVPRGTRPRGMAGLKEKVTAATERAASASTETELDPAPRALLALPAPSKHPEGSIEWFLDQVKGADNRERLDAVKAAALAVGLDRAEDAPIFREHFAARSRELKAAPKSEPETRALL